MTVKVDVDMFPDKEDYEDDDGYLLGKWTELEYVELTKGENELYERKLRTKGDAPVVTVSAEVTNDPSTILEVEGKEKYTFRCPIEKSKEPQTITIKGRSRKVP